MRIKTPITLLQVYLKGLNHDTNYGVSHNLPSVVLVGGR